MAKKQTIGVDLGGTKIFAALITRKGKLLAETKQPTGAQDGPTRVIERIAESVETVLEVAGVAKSNVQAIGIGAPGPLNPETGIILDAPNLPGWQNVPLAEILRERTGLPAFIENDVNAGTYGEFRLGAGRGKKDVIGIFVGTGIGGGLIVNGRLRSGYRHVAAELGHVVLMVDGPYCGCGKRGCLEALASRTAIVRDIDAAISAGRKSVISELVAEKGSLTSSVLANAYAQGDALTVEIMQKTQYYLGVYVGSVVNFFDPQMVILGGGVIEAMGESYLEPIRDLARQYFIAKQDADKVEIVTAKLGDYAGVLGAAMLGLERSKKLK